MAKRGRKPVLTKALKKKVLDTIKDGGSRRDAAVLARIAPSTIENEARRDAGFRSDLDWAETECKMHHIRRVKSGATHWQSSAWMLERKWHDEFGRKDNMDITSDGKAISFTLNIGDREPTSH